MIAKIFGSVTWRWYGKGKWCFRVPSHAHFTDRSLRIVCNGAILTNAHLFAHGGIPKNNWIEPEIVYFGKNNTLTCDYGMSVAPFDMDSQCWLITLSAHSKTTVYPLSTQTTV